MSQRYHFFTGYEVIRTCQKISNLIISNMIEVFSTNRTSSIGCFVNFKAAKGTLNALALTGKLGVKPAVLVCSYKNDEPQREYIATYSGVKWNISKYPKMPLPALEKTKRRRKGILHKKYPSPEACFREGFPDWLNKSYPVPACKQQGLNVRRRINH